MKKALLLCFAVFILGACSLPDSYAGYRVKVVNGLKSSGIPVVLLNALRYGSAQWQGSLGYGASTAYAVSEPGNRVLEQLNDAGVWETISGVGLGNADDYGSYEILLVGDLADGTGVAHYFKVR